jgi:hypothetical protein
LLIIALQYYAMFDNNATRGELAKLYNAEQVRERWLELVEK